MSVKFGIVPLAPGEVFAGIDWKGLNLNLAKEEGIKMDGEVIDVLPNAMFRVKLTGPNNLVTGVISGKMRMNNIKILLGDTVEIEFSAYDLTRGRITRRR